MRATSQRLYGLLLRVSPDRGGGSLLMNMVSICALGRRVPGTLKCTMTPKATRVTAYTWFSASGAMGTSGGGVPETATIPWKEPRTAPGTVRVTRIFSSAPGGTMIWSLSSVIQRAHEYS